MRFSLALAAVANVLALASAAPAEAATAATGAIAGTAGGLEINTISGTFKSLDTSAAPGTESANAVCGGFTPAQCSGLCYAYGYRYYRCLPTVCRCSN